MDNFSFKIEGFGNLLVNWLQSHGLRIILIVIVILIVNRVAKSVIDRIVRRMVPANKYSNSPQAEIKREDTLIRISHGTVRVVIWLLGAFMVLSEVGVNIGPLIAAAGVAGLAFGFGGQYLIKDLISGFFIILENQYRIGDVVCFGETCGLVEDITLRATILRDLDGTVHHVPHGTVERVANMSKKFARVNMNIGVSYSTDLEKVIEVVNETGKKLADDERWAGKVRKPIQFERVEDFANSAVIIKVLGETLPLEQWAVAGEFRKRVKIAFDKAKIEIPFPQMDVHVKSK